MLGGEGDIVDWLRWNGDVPRWPRLPASSFDENFMTSFGVDEILSTFGGSGEDRLL